MKFHPRPKLDCNLQMLLVPLLVDDVPYRAHKMWDIDGGAKVRFRSV